MRRFEASSDERPLDTERIIRALAEHRVNYVLIDGIAARIGVVLDATGVGGYEEHRAGADEFEVFGIRVTVAGLDDLIAGEDDPHGARCLLMQMPARGRRGIVRLRACRLPCRSKR